MALASGSIYQSRYSGRSSLSVSDAARPASRGRQTPPYTPKLTTFDEQSPEGEVDSLNSSESAQKERTLYFPISLSTDSYVGSDPPELNQEDIDILVAVRNMFAFLSGQPLVATHNCPTLLTIFNSVADMLRKYEFTNMDGSSFGEAATSSLSFYMEELKLADVRTSVEKTLEGLILGENLRSTELWTEAFVHAVGKYDAIRELPLFNMVSKGTSNRLDRAAMDLVSREQSVNIRLADFDFPSIWSGVAGSTSSVESRILHFNKWRLSFMDMRKHTMSYYKELYGSWPPKGSTRRGLNRLVLRGLYTDFTTLYDLLVDRTNITTRAMDQDGSSPGSQTSIDPFELDIPTIRRILAEYDRSSPPVQPPVPFDVPRLPNAVSFNPHYARMSPVERNKYDNKCISQDHQTIIALTKAYNIDIAMAKTQNPFVESFKTFEARHAKNLSVVEMREMRIGYWLFLYAVIQSLPLLVVDAPGLMYSEGVEYFLCEPPKGGVPWNENNEGTKRAWYGVAGSSGVVAMPSDVVEHGVEAIYQRSHCWVVANKWAAELPGENPAFSNPDQIGSPMSPLAPPGFAEGYAPSRPGSSDSNYSRGSDMEAGVARLNLISRSSGNRSSIALGLEQLPIPPMMRSDSSRSSSLGPSGHNRIGSSATVGTPTAEGGGLKSFDEILGSMGGQKSDKEKKKGKKGK
jgi:hypothetical protein